MSGDKINDELFTINRNVKDLNTFNKALNNMNDYFEHMKSNFLGYQCNQKLDFEKDLAPYLNMHLNNIGDPFHESNCGLNTKWIERHVLDYFANLWHLPTPHLEYDPNSKMQMNIEEIRESYWGYVTSMGCTEGNIYGLRNARDYLSGKVLATDLCTKSLPLQGKMRAGFEGREIQPSEILLHERMIQGHFMTTTQEMEEMELGEAIKLEGGIEQMEEMLLNFRLKQTKQLESNKDLIKNPNAYQPVIFYSSESHYSIDKTRDLLALVDFAEMGRTKYPQENPLDLGKPWPDKVPCDINGAMDMDALVTLVEFFAKKGHPIMINFNYGTTFKGAYDDVGTATQRLLPILEKHGLKERMVRAEVIDLDNEGNPTMKVIQTKRTGYWFHVDGALGAVYAPLLERARNTRPEFNAMPSFDFRNPIQSIAISCHKFIGTPWPMGVYMTRTKYLLNFDTVSYISSTDSTLSGSRNGFSSLVIWHHLMTHSNDDEIKKILSMMDMCKMAYEKLENLQKKLKDRIDLHLHRSPFSLSILFREPDEQIVKRFSLSLDEIGGIRYAHIFIMEHVTEELIDRLIHALSEEHAFPTLPTPREELMYKFRSKRVVKATTKAPSKEQLPRETSIRAQTPESLREPYKEPHHKIPVHMYPASGFR